MYEELKPALSGKSVVPFGSYGWGDGEWMRNWTDDCAAASASLAADHIIANGAPDAAASDACRGAVLVGNSKKCGHHVRLTDCADCFAELKAAFSRQR